MRNVVLYELVSLDGVAEHPDEFFDQWDDDVDAHSASVIAGQDTVILGRRTYDEWVAFWPASDIRPFASFINGVPKLVATSTPLSRQWHNASTIDGGLLDMVQRLKRSPGGDIGVHGSLELARTLLAAGAVDELRLVVAPVVVGHGRRLLDGVPRTALELRRSATSSAGYLIADYHVRR